MRFFQPEPDQPPACVSEVKNRVHLSGVKRNKFLKIIILIAKDEI